MKVWVWLALILALVITPLSSFADAVSTRGHSPAVADASQQIDHPVVDGLVTDRSIDHLVLHYDPAWADRLAPLLEATPEIRDKILADLGPGALEDVQVYFLPEIERYFTARDVPARSPHWASGLAILQENVILIRLEPTPGGRLELDRTLGHELSHIALYRFTGGQRLPVWFIEGFAVFQTEPWNQTRGETLNSAALGNSLQPLSRYEKRFPSQSSEALLAYAESAHFIHWLTRKHGREELRALLGRMHEGERFHVAFEQVYGRHFSGLEAEWRQSLAVPYGWIPGVLSALGMVVGIGILILLFAYRVRRRRREAFKRLARSSGRVRERIPSHLQNFAPFRKRGT